MPVHFLLTFKTDKHSYIVVNKTPNISCYRVVDYSQKDKHYTEVAQIEIWVYEECCRRILNALHKISFQKLLKISYVSSNYDKQGGGGGFSRKSPGGGINLKGI